MAVTFVIGRAGSGKTTRCLDRIKAKLREQPLGPPVFWILPRQATFTAERELTCQLGAFSRARIVSFDQLGRQIAEECGDIAVPEVTAAGRQMVLGHLLREHQPRLAYFRSVARRPGLPAELDVTFAEFERSGRSPAELADLIDQLRQSDPADAQGPSLQAKMADLLLLYEAYTQYLGQERLDQHHRLMLVLKKIEQCGLLRGASAYIDAFVEFTNYERQVIAGLGKVCASVEVCLMLDPTSPTLRDPHHLPNALSLFRRGEETYRKLRLVLDSAGVEVRDPVLLAETHRFISPSLGHVERWLFGKFGKRSSTAAPPEDGAGGHSGAPLTGSAPIRFLEAPSPAAEVDATAREIRSLLQEGLRFRDIGVLARDTEMYHGLIDRSFSEHGIPYFVDRRRSAAHHPLLQLVRAMLQIARWGWHPSAVMMLLKSGLAGVTLDEADEIEAYLVEHRLRGRSWEDPTPWDFRRPAAGDPAATDADASLPAEEQFEGPHRMEQIRRQTAHRLAPLSEMLCPGRPVMVRNVAAEIFLTLARFNVPRVLAEWIDRADAPEGDNDPEQAREHEQVWAEFSSLLEQMVDLLGERQMTPDEFAEVLETGLEEFDLALTPPTVDQVLVGAVERTRTPRLRACIVLGLGEGQFPQKARADSIFSSTDRREMRSRRIELDPDAHQRQLDERLLAYLAFTRASEQLIVTRPLVDAEGHSMEASPFWLELRRLLPGVEPVAVGQGGLDDARNIATPRQLVTALMRWARLRSSAAGTAFQSSRSFESLYQWLAAYPCNDDAIDRVRYRAWAALGYNNEAKLSPDTAAALFASPLRASAAQLETFAACPFRHFLKYGLRLSDRAAPSLTALDMSQVYHEVLESVVARLLDQRQDWRNLSPDAARAMVSQCAQAATRELRREVLVEDARSQYQLARIERTLAQVLASIREMILRGRFQPAHTSVKFGGAGPLPGYCVTTPLGAQVLLSGQIDRIDRAPTGDAAVVYDYKLAAGPLAMGDVYHGLSLQLLTYLLVLESNGPSLAGRPLAPAAAFAFRLLRGLGKVDHPDDALAPNDPKFHLRSKPRGVLDARFLDSLDSASSDGGWSDVVQAYTKADGHLGYRDSSDAADAGEFAALLGFVRQRIGELADQVMSGSVAVLPYRIGRRTPCPRCEFRPVCRFDPTQDRYRPLVPLGRGEALDKMTARSGDAE